ncbi:hypothetical protein Hamer_G005443 [Homarus americanus]|uniref:Uncharacterized protein n=1 Tax=Homarus americanus TaxID=6706 RepID=A0A8J5MXJ8_HOMAM|nr:hypothetical protein Hamer_G005443 [Homarus americanus]
MKSPSTFSGEDECMAMKSVKQIPSCHIYVNVQSPRYADGGSVRPLSPPSNKLPRATAAEVRPGRRPSRKVHTRSIRRGTTVDSRSVTAHGGFWDDTFRAFSTDMAIADEGGYPTPRTTLAKPRRRQLSLVQRSASSSARKATGQSRQIQRETRAETDCAAGV